MSFGIITPAFDMAYIAGRGFVTSSPAGGWHVSDERN